MTTYPCVICGAADQDQHGVCTECGQHAPCTVCGTDWYREPERHCLVDGAVGRYVPQEFAKRFDCWEGITVQDWETILAGPDTPNYWDAWDNILDNARCTKNGKTWCLEQDGDLFALEIK